MAADLNSGSAVALRAGPELAHRQRRRPDRSRTSCSSTARTTGRENTRDNRANLYGDAARLREHAQRGLRQADVHADQLACWSTSATATRSAIDTSDAVRRRTPSATTGTGSEAAAADRHRRGLVDHQLAELRDLQVHALRARDAGPAGQHRGRRVSTGRRHAARHHQPRHAGPAHRAGAGRRPDGATTRSSSRSSTATATSQNGVADRRRHRRLRVAVRRQRLLPRRRPDRLQPDARHARSRTTCTSAISGTPTPRTWSRSSNGWGLITVPGGRTELPAARRSSTPRAFQQQSAGGVPRRSTRSTESQSFEINDTIRWKQLDVQRRRARQQRHALRPGPARGRRRRSPASCSAPGQQVQDVRDPVQQDDPAAPRRDLGLQRQGHRLRQLRHATTRRRARCRAPRRGTATCIGTFIDAHFDAQRRAVRRRRRSAPRPASCSSTT